MKRKRLLLIYSLCAVIYLLTPCYSYAQNAPVNSNTGLATASINNADYQFLLNQLIEARKQIEEMKKEAKADVAEAKKELKSDVYEKFGWYGAIGVALISVFSAIFYFVNIKTKKELEIEIKTRYKTYVNGLMNDELGKVEEINVLAKSELAYKNTRVLFIGVESSLQRIDGVISALKKRISEGKVERLPVENNTSPIEIKDDYDIIVYVPDSTDTNSKATQTEEQKSNEKAKSENQKLAEDSIRESFESLKTKNTPLIVYWEGDQLLDRKILKKYDYVQATNFPLTLYNYIYTASMFKIKS